MKINFPKEAFLKLWHNKWLFGAIIALVATFLSLFTPVLFENLELKSINFRFGIRGPQDTEQDNIAIVAIDEETFTALNLKWPLPRSLYARVIENLHLAGAKLIVVDIEFSGQQKGTKLQEDIALRNAIGAAGDVVLAAEFIQSTNSHLTNDSQNARIEAPVHLFPKSNKNIRWGLINIDEDSDGFVRRYPLYQRFRGKIALPLSVVAYQAIRRGANGAGVKPDEAGYFVLGAKKIPKIGDNYMFINYRGPAQSFQTFSFSSILDDSRIQLAGDEDTDIFEIYRESAVFKNKVVFIGASSEALQDVKFAPFFNSNGGRRKLPGVEVHANALSTILRGDFLTQQGFTSALFVLLLLAGITMFLTKWLKPFRGLFATLGLILLYVLASIYFFINQLVIIDFVAPIFAIGLTFVGNTVHQILTEQRERVRIKKSWEQYMSKDVIDNMLESGSLPTFGGERRELTVLFSDIRSFTSFSEKHSSNKVVRKLSEYLTEMVDVIFQNGGTLDKFVGDEIMAIYGAPYYYKQHAEKACLTALEMVKRLRAMQKSWSAGGEDYFQIGIGINSGKVILGNLGSSQLFDYTVIGDDVNLGARLEGTNKQYGTTIIISEATYRQVKRKAVVRELDVVRVKGKKKPVKIFELRGMEPVSEIEQDLIIDVYTAGLNYYKELKWYQALKEFKRVLRYFPTDGPTRVYIKRCMDFMETSPPRNWDGVYEFTTK